MQKITGNLVKALIEIHLSAYEMNSAKCSACTLSNSLHMTMTEVNTTSAGNQCVITLWSRTH